MIKNTANIGILIVNPEGQWAFIPACPHVKDAGVEICNVPEGWVVTQWNPDTFSNIPARIGRALLEDESDFPEARLKDRFTPYLILPPKEREKEWPQLLREMREATKG